MAKKTKKKVKKKTPKKKNTGAKTKYTTKTANVVRILMACGMNLGQVSETLIVSPRTLWNWRQKYPEFDEAVAEGRKERKDRGRDTILDFSEPHDEVTEKRKSVVLKGKNKKGETVEVPAEEVETTTKKGVISERLLIKVLEGAYPEEYGKTVGVKHGADDELMDILKRIDGTTRGLPSESER